MGAIKLGSNLGNLFGKSENDVKSIYMQKYVRPCVVDESNYTIDKSDGTCKIRDI